MDLGLNHLPTLPSVQPLGSVGKPTLLFAEPRIAAKQHSISASMPDIGETFYMPAAGYLKRTKASLASLLLTISLLVGVSLFFLPLCISVRGVNTGATARRLADADSGEEHSSGSNPFFVGDQWTSLDADELAALCDELGEWTPPAASHSTSAPSIPMPEVGSTSKGHVSESIGQIVQSPRFLSGAPSNEKEPQAGSYTQRRGKRLSRGGFDGYGESQGKKHRLTYDSSVGSGAVTQSSAVLHFPETVRQTAGTLYAGFNPLGNPPLRTSVPHQQWLLPPVVNVQGAVQGQPEATPVLRQASTIPPQTSAPSTGIVFPPSESFGDPEQPSASQSGWVPAAQFGLSASTGPSPQRSNEAPARQPRVRESLATEAPNAPSIQHPFVRTPTLMPYVNIDDVVNRIEDSEVSYQPIHKHLRTVRYVSLQPALNHLEAEELVRAVMSLAKRALSSMTTQANVRASFAADSLGRRFLVLEAFHRLLKITGDSNQRLRELWSDLLAKIPTAFNRQPWGTWDKKRAFHHELSKNLSAALELYKNGSSPSEEEIISIKRRLFCMEFSPRCFRAPKWDLWRQDDEEFQGAP